MSKLNLFLKTITPEILEPIDYVDWKRIEKKVNSYRREIALLQSLRYSGVPQKDLAELLLESPRILKLLQILIAHTPREVWFADGRHIKFKEDIENLQNGNSKRAEEIALIFLEMGLIDFLKSVESVRDCVRGVLIGLEPNTRKNRRGKKFETTINDLIETAVEDLKKETGLTLKVERNLKVDLLKEQKTVDFAVFVHDESEPRAAIEVNFYSVSGSKPSETLPRAYPEVQRGLEEKDIGFIVITDGKLA